MKSLFAIFFGMLFVGSSFAEKPPKRIKLSTISLEVPEEVTKGNKISVTTGGLATYAWNRLKTDSSSYYYTYSFRYTNGLFEFRETSKEDIYEWHESTYPKLKKSKEMGFYNEKAFVSIDNPLLKGKLFGITNETKGKVRKITVIYKFNKTTQFIASIKSAYNGPGFLAMQDSLVKMLETVQIDPYLAPEHAALKDPEGLKGQVSHAIIDVPVGLSNDFNNPVTVQCQNGDIIMAFAHSTGTELFRYTKDWQLKHHHSFDMVIHDLIPQGDEYFSLASTEYNKLSYGIYPSLFLSKHSPDGKVQYFNRVFKKFKLRFPGNQVFDYYSRDNVCLEIVDSLGLVYANSERKFSDFQVGQAGAYKLFSTVAGMKKKADKDLWHVSHCFAQKSIADNDYVYLFSLGDNFPRSLSMSKINILLEKDAEDSISFYHEELFKIKGNKGDNYIMDTHMSEPVFFNNRIYLVVETESGAKTNSDQGNSYSSNRGKNDLFLISVDKEGENSETKQITKTKNFEEVNPKLAVHNNQLLIIYTEIKYSSASPFPSMEDRFIYLDEKGRRKTKGAFLPTYYANEEKSDCKMPDSPINRDGNELLKLKDGSVVWIRLLKNTRQIEVVRFQEEEK